MIRRSKPTPHRPLRCFAKGTRQQLEAPSVDIRFIEQHHGDSGTQTESNVQGQRPRPLTLGPHVRSVGGRKKAEEFYQRVSAELG